MIHSHTEPQAKKGDLGVQGTGSLIGRHRRQVQQGAKGDKGDRGEKGEKGVGGITGLPGREGAKGEIGVQGPKGSDGFPGPKGEFGEAGQKGSKGEAGELGDRGITGEKGETGHSGLPGKIGVPGKDGANGMNGTEGQKGEAGQNGRDGFDGSKGDMAEKGVKGDMGFIGPKGEPGRKGVPGPSVAVGGLYTHWGRSDCPSGVELVYAGMAGGSNRGTDYFCFPFDPDYSSRSVTGFYYAHAVEYRQYPGDLQYQNTPCAVCYIPTRPTIMTIPAKLSCPAGWTVEYTGYLMASNYYRSKHECVDFDPVSVGSNSNADQLGFYSIRVSCDSDLPCPSSGGGGTADQAITCVVCSL